MQIRQRQPQDSQALFDLFNGDAYQWGAASRELFEHPTEIDRFLSGLSPRRVEAVAVDEAGAVMGYAGLYLFEGKLAHGAWVMIGVAEAHQRKGVGRRLIETLLLTARNAGLRRVQLTVWADNSHAIRLYESLGFETEGRHRDFLNRDGVFVDALTMAVVLS